MSGSGSGKTTLTVMTVENEWDKKTIQAVEETLG
jgi:multiple sugar transport system substrate-binding protein